MLLKSYFVHIFHAGRGHPQLSVAITHIWWRSHQTKSYTPTPSSQRRLLRWLRKHTNPTEIVYDDERGCPATSYPVRTNHIARWRHA